MTYFRENIEKAAGYTPGLQPDDTDVVKLNTNENPYPPSPEVLAYIAGLNSDSLRRYPPILWDEFRCAAAELHGVRPEQIICGNGADELLAILVRCCCDGNRSLAYPVPTYSLYPVLARIQDCPVIEVPFDDDYAIPSRLAETGAALTFFCNPNAPSCTFVSSAEIANLAGRIDGVLAIDEAYVDFAEENCLRLTADFENIVILRSMSKGYSLAGLRMGYAIGSQRIIDAMLKVKDSYNVSIVTQVAATAALRDQAYFRSNIDKIKAQRSRLIDDLRQLGFELADSSTNFVLARPRGVSAKELYNGLIDRGIYIRYFQQADLADKVRITVGTAEQNDSLIAAIKQILH